MSSICFKERSLKRPSLIERDGLFTLYPQTKISILGMTTRGDQILDHSLSEIGGESLFTKELEQVLEDGQADISWYIR